jgi:hypothetical protein
LGSDQVDRTTTASNSAATARVEAAIIAAAIILEEFDGDSPVVPIGTRMASRTEGSPEDLVIG